MGTNLEIRERLSRRHFTDLERKAHVEAFEGSGQSMEAYCSHANLGLSTLHRWVSRYGSKQRQAPMSERRRLIPVTVLNESAPSADGLRIKLGCGIEMMTSVENFGSLYRQIKGLEGGRLDQLNQ